MDRDLIIQNIEQLLNAEIDDTDISIFSGADVVENAVCGIAIRLINTYRKYNDGLAGPSDYLGALRGFMLAFQAELRIKDISSLEYQNYGIHYNPTTEKYYTIYEIPDYIKHARFVEDAFVNINKKAPENSTGYSLQTNEYITELTGYYRFKSEEQK